MLLTGSEPCPMLRLVCRSLTQYFPAEATGEPAVPSGSPTPDHLRVSRPGCPDKLSATHRPRRRVTRAKRCHEGHCSFAAEAATRGPRRAAAIGVTQRRTPRRPTPALPSSGASRSRRRLPCSARIARLVADGHPLARVADADRSVHAEDVCSGRSESAVTASQHLTTCAHVTG